MKKLIAASICTAFAISANAVDSDEQRTTRSAYGPDNTSDVRHEPCPDYFDSDWAETNKTHPCVKAMDEDGNMPKFVEVPVEDRQMTDRDMQNDRSERDQNRQADFTNRNDRNPSADRVCSTEDFSDDAIADSDYDRMLNDANAGDRESISDDFSPSSETAKSVAQLEDTDLSEKHYVATFDALDDDNSNTIDKGEALGVRGLADIFDEVDFNNDGVLTAGEFELHFAGTVYTGDGLCVDGERITSADALDRNYSASL